MKTKRATPSDNRGPALLTLQQAAVDLGVPYTSIRDLVLKGHLPRVQLGDSRRIWIKRADLEQLVANSQGVV